MIEITGAYFGHEANLIALTAGDPDTAPRRLIEGLRAFDYYYRRAVGERMRRDQADADERIEEEKRKAQIAARAGRP